MPDVGILQLSIQDNSEKATGGLTDLADALSRVKTAVGDGLKLSGIAKNIENISRTVNTYISETTIRMLGDFGDSLSKLKGLENVRINIKSAGSAGAMTEEIQSAIESAQDMGDEFENVESSITEIKESISEFGSTAEEVSNSVKRINLNEMFDVSQLPFNALGDKMDESAQEVRQYGQIVKDTFEEVQNVASKDLSSNFEKSQSELYAIIPYAENLENTWESMAKRMGETRVFSSMEEAAEKLGISLDEVKRRLQSTLDYISKNNTVTPTYESIEQFAQLNHMSLEEAKKMVVDFKAEVEKGSDNPTINRIMKSVSDESEEMGERIDLLREKVAILKNELAEGIESGDWENKRIINTALQIDSLESQIDRLKSKLSSENTGEIFGSAFAGDIVKTTSQLELLQQKYDGMKQKLNEDIQAGRLSQREIASRALQIQNLGNKIETLREKQEAAKSVTTYSTDYTNSVAENLTQLDLLKAKITEAEARYNQLYNTLGASSSKTIQAGLGLQDLKNKLNEMAEASDEAKNSIKGMSNSAEESGSSVISLKTIVSDFIPHLSKLGAKLWQIAKYRALRTIIKTVSSAFSEGLENVYYYSKAINGDFASSMDSAASSVQQLKNSIGASLTPVLTALIPTFQSIASAIVDVINYINQFFSLLNGQTTWTKAIYNATTAYDELAASASDASDSTNELLADWDELNIIQSSSSGSSSSSSKSLEDYATMFEEVSEFESWIKDLVNWIKDNLDTILEVAEAIGITLLAWKVSSALSSVLGEFSSLIGAVATIYLTLELTDIFGKKYTETGDIGWFIADALTGAVGSTIAGMIVGKLLGSAWGSVTAGFTLILSGEINLENALSASAQAKTAEAQMLRILGSVEEGVGAALIAYGFTASAGFADVVGLGVAAYEYVINTLAAVNITEIKWGTQSLSAEDVDQFVKDQMLAVDIEAQISITTAAIDLVSGEKEKLSEKASAILNPLNMLRLGINVDESLAEIESKVFGTDGLIEQFKTYMSAQNDLVSTTETYVPTIDENGENISGEIIEASNNAYTELTAIMDQLGTDLMTHLTNAMDTTLSEEMRANELKWVEEISDTMIRVSAAATKATISSDALTDLTFTLSSSTNKTYEDIINAYESYKDQLTQANTEAKKAEASSFASYASVYTELANDALEKANGDETDETYQKYNEKAKYYADEYEKIMSNLAKSVEDSVNEAVQPGQELVKESVRELLSGAQELRDGQVELFTDGYIKGLPTGLAGGLKEETSLALQDLVFAGLNEGITDENASQLENSFVNFLQAIIKDYFPNDWEDLTNLLNIGAIDYSDIFDFDTLFSNMENIQGYDTEVFRELWERINSTLKETEEQAKDTKDALGETIGMTVEETAEIEPDIIWSDFKDSVSVGLENVAKELMENPTKTSYQVEADKLFNFTTEDVDADALGLGENLSNTSENALDVVEETTNESRELLEEFFNWVNKKVEEMEPIKITTETETGTSGRYGNASTITGSAGISDSGYSTSGITFLKAGNIGTGTTGKVEVTDKDLASSINSSNESQTGTIVSHLRTLENRLQSLLNKNWTVSLGTSTAAGFWSGANSDLVTKVTGN